MGSDKALIELDGRPLVLRVFDRLKSLSDDVFVVTKRPPTIEALGLRAVVDHHDAQTPVAGIATALRTAAHDHVFVCACDMPFVSVDVVRLLVERIDGMDAVVSVRNGRPEPLHAVWATSAAEALEAALRDGERAVHRALKRMRVGWVSESEWSALDPEGRTFINLNTPEDIAHVRS